MTLTRTGNTTGTSTVHYARTGGTATPGTDFALTDGDLTFAAGQTSKTIPIVIVQDSNAEPDETVQVTLSSPSGGTTLGTSVSTLTITDDDVAPGAQPDLLISVRPGSGYRGDDVYNNDGSGQKITRKAHRRQVRTFYVAVTNDGSSSSAFTLWGSTALRGSKVTYSNKGTDITKSMTSTAGATTTLAPDQGALIRVDVRITRKAAIGSKKRMLVIAQDADTGALNDTVMGTVKVVR